MLPEAQSDSIVDSELRCLLNDMAYSTPDLELGNSADDFSNYSVMTATIAQGLIGFLDEDDLLDDQGVEISEDEEVSTGRTLHGEEVFTGRTLHNGMLLLLHSSMQLTFAF